MAGTRELAEAQSFRRRQMLGSFLQGGRAEGLPARGPTRAWFGGIAIALVVAIAVGAHGYLSGRPPAGWLDDGRVVIDRDKGGLYLSVGGVLHPVPNETSLLLLTDGQPKSHVSVTHTQLLTADVGTELGFATAPVSPPEVGRADGTLTACTGPSGRLSVVLGATTPGTDVGNAVVLRGGGARAGTELVAAGVRHVLAGGAARALTIAGTDVWPTSTSWLGLLPAGSPLAVRTLPTPPRGKAPLASPGLLVKDDSTGDTYVVEQGGIAPVPNATSLLLLAGSGGVMHVAHDVILRARLLAAAGYRDLPVAPLSLASGDGQGAPAGTVSCVRTGGAGQRVLSALPAPADDVPTSGVGQDSPRLYAARGRGALVRASAAGDILDAAHPDYLLAQGQQYPITSQQALDALGYDTPQVATVPAAWLSLLPAGPALELPGAP